MLYFCIILSIIIIIITNSCGGLYLTNKQGTKSLIHLGSLSNSATGLPGGGSVEDGANS